MGEGLAERDFMGKDGLTAIPPSGSFSCSKWSESGGSSNLGEIWPNTIRCAPGKQSVSLGGLHGFLLHGDAGGRAKPEEKDSWQSSRGMGVRCGPCRVHTRGRRRLSA